METVIVVSEADLKRCIREVLKEELSALTKASEQPWQAFEEPLLTRAEMAAHLKISLVTLRKWVKKGLPCIRQEGRILFLKSDVVRALKLRSFSSRTKSK